MKRILILLLVLSMLAGMLAGCTKPQEETTPTTTAVETTEAGPTVPPDGDPDDVTCKGTYSREADASKVVARAGDAELTNGMLQAFYWAEVAAFKLQNNEIAPDFDAPLDTQIHPEDGISWQQFFLAKALDAWHIAQALVNQGVDEGLPTEEAYQPDPAKHEEYMTGMPANEFLYGYHKEFVPNTMHRAYLDNIPAMLEELAGAKGYADAETMAREAFGAALKDVQAYSELLNRGYMYFTNLGYEFDPEEEEITAYADAQGFARGEGAQVDIHHMLLHPEENPYSKDDGTVDIGADGRVTCSEKLWKDCERRAESLVQKWKGQWKRGEATFANMTNQNSVDRASALVGGEYRNLSRGQLLPELDSWCFDPERKAGDVGIIRSAYGVHVLYLTRRTDLADVQARDAMIEENQKAILDTAREKYPMEVEYASIGLNAGRGDVWAGDVLYPDVAHERFPEAPLYLQQDYGNARYGAYPLRTHGCGITTMAMLASYMADTPLTPPQLATRYATYCSEHGTDGVLFRDTPAEMGFYLKKQVFNGQAALDALREGYPVVCVQTKGFWTRGGHYLLLENVTEDDMVQVRDSNIFNYGRLADHKQDRFKWSTVPPAAKSFWIFQKKVVNIPACTRCGDPENHILVPDSYLCHKCRAAELRRSGYLNGISS